MYLQDAFWNKKSFSGSCACSLLILNKQAILINLGDSRAICSKNNGKTV